MLSYSEDHQLQKIVHCLQLARHIYISPLEYHIFPVLSNAEQKAALAKLQRGFQVMVSYVLPWVDISTMMYHEITEDTMVVLGLDALNEENRYYDSDDDSMDLDLQYTVSYRRWKKEPSAEARKQLMEVPQTGRIDEARDRLLTLFNGLQLVGLGGEKAQKIFATVMNAMLTEFVRAAYSGHWKTPSLAVQHLDYWIENVFAQLVVQVLAIINTPESDDSDERSADHLDVGLSDLKKWQEIGVARLGELRTSELFSVIVEWPASTGAIEELRRFTLHPAARYYLTHQFINTLNNRLLHPGASTSEILQLYISIIRAFNLLDPRGVLLDRIARPIRRYLRDRDDTVKVIVSGLLADPVDDEQQGPSSGDVLVELSTELTKTHQRTLHSNTGELDWDDMHWTPDPVDAAPDYRKPKNSDVIGSVISLFESKETFVKEMQNMLADRLLQNRGDFDQEMSVLELLKLRFGDNVLQACEVMLRDIFDSKRVDAIIRHDHGLSGKRATPRRPTTPGKAPQPSKEVPELHAKILSHFFWPEVQGHEFKVPGEISKLQQRYADGFESLKQSRKLTWLNGLGQATVELDLEDRVFVDEVTTWQATVIYAFQSSSEGLTKSITQLSEELEMNAPIVRSACLFWVSKRILTEVERDTFRVLEVLPTDEGDHGGRGGMDETGGTSETANEAAAAADAAAAAAAKESAEAAAMEKMNLHWQFIVGMLTNQGAMPLQQIVMMLKIAVPGGFPFSNEELREFLAGMVAKGKLEIVSGGSYKIVQ